MLGLDPGDLRLDPAAMLARDDVEVVDICTPQHLLRAIAVPAATDIAARSIASRPLALSPASMSALASNAWPSIRTPSVISAANSLAERGT